MTSSDVERQVKLIDASKKIATIYLRYGQLEAAQDEFKALCHTLQELPTNGRQD